MKVAGSSSNRAWIALVSACAGFLLVAGVEWHPDAGVRRATGLVLSALILWIFEAAPIGVVAMGIPIAGTLAGVLPWRDAIGAWGDPVVFLFLGAFLLARAIEKHGVLDRLLSRRSMGGGDSAGRSIAGVMGVSGAISTLQNNTAVTAILLPVVRALGKGRAWGFAPLLALAWGSTFGGMATPVGTAPNFIGYAAMKRLESEVSFLSWMRVGVPVWFGTSLIGWAILWAAARLARKRGLSEVVEKGGWMEQLASTDVGPPREVEQLGEPVDAPDRRMRRAAAGAFGIAVLLWVAPGVIQSVCGPEDRAAVFVRTYLPESLVPLAVAWGMFVIPVGRRGERILERRDFQMLDWETLFLIAGGMSLGRILEVSGAAAELARAATGWEMSPVVLMLALSGVTVLLSELTSNTATASLMVPIAGSLAAGLGVPPVGAIWLVSLSASLGFAMPISTPPNALVYGTRMVPLRTMMWTGLTVDLLSVIWVVACVRIFGGGA